MFSQFQTILDIVANPVKKLVYFEKYLLLVNQLHQNRHSFYLVNSLLLVQVVHLVHLWIYSPDSKLERAFFYDFFYLLIHKPIYNLFISFPASLIIYFNFHLFIKPDTQLNSILHSILLSENAEFFLEPQFRNQNVIKIVQKYFLLQLNIFQSFLGLAGI